MRYLETVTFVKESSGTHYDPDKGEWIESEPIKKTFSANVTDIGTERSAKIFGDIKQGAKVMRMMPLLICQNTIILSLTTRDGNSPHTVIPVSVTLSYCRR